MLCDNELGNLLRGIEIGKNEKNVAVYATWEGKEEERWGVERRRKTLR
jgi:hypothetical protein